VAAHAGDLGVKLTGSLRPGVSAKDVILELLRRYAAKAGCAGSSSTTGLVWPR
jgi:homoaconitase/3-isopropylmalate dehydratase large subunit